MELKQRNVLKTRGKKDDHHNDSDQDNKKGDNKEIGVQWYKELQDIWWDWHMTRFSDFLEQYNNLDVGPFIQAVEECKSLISITTSIWSRWRSLCQASLCDGFKQCMMQNQFWPDPASIWWFVLHHQANHCRRTKHHIHLRCWRGLHLHMGRS